MGEILDGAISCVRAHPRVMLGLSALVVTASQLLNVAVTWLLLRDLNAAATELEADATFDDAVNLLADTAGVAILSAVVAWLAQIVLTGMLTVVVGRAVLGEPVSAGDAWSRLRPQLLRVIGVSLLTALIVLGAFVACVLPVILAAGLGAPGPVVVILGLLAAAAVVVACPYLYVSLALAGPALVLERARVLQALGRSRRLVRGSFWRVLGILLLATVIAFVISSIVQFPFSLLSTGGQLLTADPEQSASLLALLVAAVGGIIGGTITYPFAAAVSALLYVDQRMRREALDLELARAAGVAAPSGPPPAQRW